MMELKPFAKQGHFTSVDNAVFDEIMPMLNGNEWKVLSFIIRKTIGWHKDMDGIAYSQFRNGTGIKSNTTIQKSINNLIRIGLVELGKTGRMSDTHFYRLNKNYTCRVTETVKHRVTFSVKPPVTETVNTKEILNKYKSVQSSDARDVVLR